jgi:putative SOS response-associated peptidase YedK
LVLTDGFWEKRQRDKQPFAILGPGALTVMAGFWEAWTSPTGEWITSCMIVLTDANEALALPHDCMAVILKPGDRST